MAENEFAPVTPGEMLKEEFLAEYGPSQNRLAKVVGISPNRIAEIVNNRRALAHGSPMDLMALRVWVGCSQSYVPHQGGTKSSAMFHNSRRHNI